MVIGLIFVSNSTYLGGGPFDIPAVGEIPAKICPGVGKFPTKICPRVGDIMPKWKVPGVGWGGGDVHTND